MKVQRYIKSNWERTDMVSGPIWDKDNWRIIERRNHHNRDKATEKWYMLRDKNDLSKDDVRFDTLAEAMNFVDFRDNLNSSRQIKSSKEEYAVRLRMKGPDGRYSQEGWLGEGDSIDIENNIYGYDDWNDTNIVPLSYNGANDLREQTVRELRENGITDIRVDVVEDFQHPDNHPQDMLKKYGVNSSRRPIKSSFVIEHWSPLLPQTQYVCDTDEGLGGTYNVDEALQFDTMMEAKQFIKEHDEEYGGKLKIHEFPIESSHKITSARYIATDPETGEVLGSADTYEEAVNEWGEDVIITDSEVGDKMDTTQGGILSSKESNHQFNQRIVNSVLTKEITEDDAIKQIASRNNMNIGFAKRIFNNLMEDKSLIQSGVMEMADDINKDFDLNGDLYSWFDDYVEDDGKSTTVGGELVRAAYRIIGRFENDGDKIGIGYGKETVNPAARYILAICNDYIDRNDIEEMLYNESRINYSDEEYEAWLQQFERTFEDYLRNHEELFHAPNKNDIWDYKEDDDVDSSVTECCIYDDNGNEYWFQKDDDGWKCTSIEYTSDPKYEVDNYVDDLDDIPDTSDDFCDFELDGFEYSAERASNGEDWIITNVSIDNGLADVNDIWETEDFEGYGIFDANGREINVSDLY